jgi:hypothetical protein
MSINNNTKRKNYNMIISDYRAQSFLQALYHTAAKDDNDIIANAASTLAVRLGSPTGKGHHLNETEQRLIRYAVKNKPVIVRENTNRRKTYKRRVSLA